ncbi:MAG: hypothetical protein HQ503_01550 [Rhodospirillales bacterium]|nr:hypothetical protein [Rhodospirillales bacterium]
MPSHLFHFTGDADVGAARNIAALGYKVVYHPDAAVKHEMPDRRHGVPEIEEWIFGEGLVTSFVVMRALAAGYPEIGSEQLICHLPEVFSAENITAIGHGYVNSGAKFPGEIENAFRITGAKGFHAHQRHFLNDADFRDWVLQPDYLNVEECYRHPDLTRKVTGE